MTRLAFRLSIAACATTFALACSPSGPPVADLGPPAEGESALWGAAGERWQADSRLPDFSFAGYRAGEALPETPIVANVRDFGARGDGEHDDTAAFRRALAEAPAGAIRIPAGRYRITEVLELDLSGRVLRGDGREETTLFFPLPLAEGLGRGPYGGPHGWAWGGGWIWARGRAPYPTVALATVARPAARGEQRLVLSTTRGLAVREPIRLLLTETEDGSLTKHLHNGQGLGGKCWIDHPGRTTVDWTVRVTAIDGDMIQLEQPLRTDVDLAWSPEVHPELETVREVGVEGLTIEFPEVAYAGHHLEPGYNAIYFSDVADSWVRDIRTVHADTALSFWNARYSTARGIEVTGRGGHYGINLAASQDCWVTDFRLENRSLHDLSVAILANGNVFSNGRGEWINFDHHRGAPYENLFTNIDVGESWRHGRFWHSSFTKSGHYTAARETLWNIRPRVSTRRFPAWPQLNVIGPIHTVDGPNNRALGDAWIEDVRQMTVPDLHAAQVARRRRRPRQTSDP